MTGIEPDWWYRQIGGPHLFGCDCQMCRPVVIPWAVEMLQYGGVHADYCQCELHRKPGCDLAGWPLRDAP